MVNKKKTKTKKRLHIGLKTEDMLTIVSKYCKESQINEQSISFATGFLTGALNNELVPLQQLTYLLQAHFFAGVYYGKDHQDKINYRYLTKKEFEARIAKEKDAFHSQSKIIKPDNNPSYVG